MVCHWCYLLFEVYRLIQMQWTFWLFGDHSSKQPRRKFSVFCSHLMMISLPAPTYDTIRFVFIVIWVYVVIFWWVLLMTGVVLFCNGSVHTIVSQVQISCFKSYKKKKRTQILQLDQPQQDLDHWFPTWGSHPPSGCAREQRGGAQSFVYSKAVIL